MKTLKFFSRFAEDQKEFAAELLDLGRASYQLRDDDNIPDPQRTPVTVDGFWGSSS